MELFGTSVLLVEFCYANCNFDASRDMWEPIEVSEADECAYP